MVIILEKFLKITFEIIYTLLIREVIMIWVIIGILMLMWLFAVIFKFVVGGLIHILLLVAAVMFIYKLVRG